MENGTMSATLAALGIDKLSTAERILLVEEIWDSIAADAGSLPLTDAQKQDLQRRLKQHQEKPEGSSWTEVKARLGART
jgi:putative addiction module component (TIGR02574 family)